MNAQYLKIKYNFLFYSFSILLIFSFFIIPSCNKDPLEKEIYSALNEGDFIKAATYCANYSGDNYKDKCLEAKNISEEEIISILSKKKDFPFMKIFIQSEKDEKIRELLKKDIYLGVKYRIIWNEISEKK